MAAAVVPSAADIPKFSIIATHSIQKKISQCLRILYPGPPAESPVGSDSVVAHPVIALVAQSQVASKAITIAEIIKRRISKQGGDWYQYSTLSSVMIELTQKEGPSKNKQNNKRRRKNPNIYNRNNQRDKGKGSQNRKEDDGEKEEEDPFVAMKEETRPIKKKVPLLTIYISRSPLPEFARAYGEQTSSP